MQELYWEKPWDTAYGIITIPVNAVFYRGYNPKYPISSYPSYFGSRETAEEYAKLPGRTLGAFRTTKHVKVVDVRFMKHLLTELFADNPHNDSVHATVLAFGLCSLYHQIELLKIRFKTALPTKSIEAMRESIGLGLFEPPGIRIADTNNDGEVMAFLAEVFDGFVDGFISPRLETPFHVEKKGFLNPECILFNPQNAGIERLPTTEPSFYKRTPIAILCVSQYGNTIIIGTHNTMKDSFYKRGGGGDPTLPAIEQFQDLIYNKDEIALGLVKRGKQNGRDYKRKNQYRICGAPHPHAPISPFDEKEFLKQTQRRF